MSDECNVCLSSNVNFIFELDDHLHFMIEYNQTIQYQELINFKISEKINTLMLKIKICRLTSNF